MNPSVSIRERRWLVGCALLAMLVISLPYIMGFWRAGENWVFTGFVINVEDGNSYLAKMLRGAQGDWLFRTPYTSFPQEGALVLLPYILLGKLTTQPNQHFQMVVIFHLFRLMAGVLVFFATYDFISLYIRTVTWRRWGTMVVTVGGGLGWILVMIGADDWLGSLPLDFFSPESFGFLSLLALPHLALARAFLLWGFVAYLSPVSEERSNVWLEKKAIIAGIFWLLLSFLQPMTTLIAGVMVFAFMVGTLLYNAWGARFHSMPWRRWWAYLWRAILAGLIASPIVLYSMIHFSSDPFLQAWTAQNILPSPHPLHYLAAYALVLPFSLFGLLKIIPANPWRGVLPVGWVTLVFVMVYSPVNVQRRLAEGSWVMWVVLAVYALETGSRKIQRIGRFGMVLSFGTSLFLIAGSFLTAWNPSEPQYRPEKEITALLQLRTLAEDSDIILTSQFTGNVLPVWTPQRVIIGHGPESIDGARLQGLVNAFYGDQATDQGRMEFLIAYNISYVWWGPPERELGKWQADQEAYLELVVDTGPYKVFRVSE